jgi:hypothetical protein
MKVSFDNIYNYVIPMTEFTLKWKFTDERKNRMPNIHLEQLKSLNKKVSKFLWDYISDANFQAEIPFKKDFFKRVEKIQITEGNENEVKKWLYQRGLPFSKDVFLSWKPNDAMIVPWKLVIKYFDDFYFADDLTIIDESLNWALLFHHGGKVYFGTNTTTQKI